MIKCSIAIATINKSLLVGEKVPDDRKIYKILIQILSVPLMLYKFETNSSIFINALD